MPSSARPTATPATNSSILAISQTCSAIFLDLRPQRAWKHQHLGIELVDCLLQRFQDWNYIAPEPDQQQISRLASQRVQSQPICLIRVTGVVVANDADQAQAFAVNRDDRSPNRILSRPKQRGECLWMTTALSSAHSKAAFPVCKSHSDHFTPQVQFKPCTRTVVAPRRVLDVSFRRLCLRTRGVNPKMRQ